jgi:hypothetical protein
MTIHFKDGSRKSISNEIAKVLQQRIIEGCGNFQIFTDKEGCILLFISLDAISYID